LKRALEAWGRWFRIRARRMRRDWRRPKGGPAGRLRRRLMLGGAVLAAVSAALAFPASLSRQAKALCEMPGRPGLADACGALGVPGVPGQAERLLWEAAKPGDCQALRDYREQFPKGVFREPAERRLAITRVEPSSEWTPLRRETAGFIARQMAPLASEAAALADARGRVEDDAGQLGCRPVDELERLMKVEIVNAVPSCRRIGGGHTCALDYRAVCRMTERKMVEICG
jgi:hypothetical protein